MTSTRPVGKRFIAPALCFILTLSVFAFVTDIRLDTFLEFSRCAISKIPSQSLNSSKALSFLSSSSSSLSSASSDIRILIGILTVANQYQRRHLLRLVYGAQSIVGAQVDVKFVICSLTTEDQKVLISLEIMRFDDIIILDCHENLNNGKTFTYFSSLPGMLNETNRPYPPYHYVMKGDDDTYFRLNELVKSLEPLSREDLYYGYVIPCDSMNPFKQYMSGMGYLVSWDIVEWIQESDIPKNHLEGPEDKVFGEWIHWGNRGKKRYNAKWSMYNFPDNRLSPPKCTHELWPDTVAVHLLKNEEKWIRTLRFFNVTNNLKPSKLYHIDLI